MDNNKLVKKRILQSLLSFLLSAILLPGVVFAAELPVLPDTAVTEESSRETEAVSDPSRQEEVPLLLQETETDAQADDTVDPAPEETKPEETTETEEEPETDPEEKPLPDAPVMKACKNTENGVLISWKKVTEADSYIVYLCNTKKGTKTEIGTTTATSLEYTGVTSGKTYTFTVAAVREGVSGSCDVNGSSVCYLSCVQPAVSRKGSAARISWNKTAGAAGYYLYRRTEGSSSWTKLKTLKDTSWIDATVKKDVAYEYLVRAYLKKNGMQYISSNGVLSATRFCIFSPVQLKTAKSAEDGVKLTWKKVSGAVKYRILRKQEGGKWKALKKTASVSFVDKTAEAGRVYYYTVAAYDTSGIRGDHNTTGLPGVYLTPPKAPKLSNVENGVKLTWKKAAGASGYRIYRKKKAGDKWEKLKNVKKVKTWTDTGVKEGTAYDYLVLPFKKVNGKKMLSIASEKSGASIIRLTAPTLKTITAKSGGVYFTWSAVTGAKEYRLYRRGDAAAPWELLGTATACKFTDKTAAKGVHYEYTVAAVSGKSLSSYGTSFLAGMNLSAPVLKKLTSSSAGLTLSWKAVSGATHYAVYRIADSGKLKRIGKTKATSFTDTTVSVDTEYTYTVRAYHKASTKCLSSYDKQGKTATFNDPVRALAKKRLKLCGGTLKKAYDWAVSIPYSKAQPAVYNASGYAAWSFENKAGDCLGKAAAFLMMARELGYECYLMYGYVPQRGGGMVDHGWVEIVDNGATYICDPDFEYEMHYNGYFINYGQSGTWMYSDYHRLPDR